MRKNKNLKILLAFIFFGLAVLFTSLAINSYQLHLKSRAEESDPIIADQHCEDGIYYVKNPNNTNEQISCGRGVCDGVSYSETANINHVSAGKCWVGTSTCGPACQGFVPLCCYKMAETGNAEDCPFPERGFCMRQQCEKQTQDSNCGAQQGAYCVDECVADRGDIPFFSLADRLEGRKTPSTNVTNTPIPPTQQPSNTPAPSESTVTPSPTISNPITPQNTPSISPIPTVTQGPTSTNTPTPTITSSPTPIPTSTNTPIPTNTPSPTPTFTLTPTSTPTSTPTPTNTPTPIPTFTPYPTYTVIPTNTIIPSYTPQPTQVAQIQPTTPQNLTVNSQPPGITPWAFIAIPLGLILIGLLL